MSNWKRHLVTAALPYANGPIHVGHLSGAYLPADIYVRFLKLKGEDVLFVCGSDEHGVPITLTARKEGKLPQEIVDRYHNLMKNSFERLGIDFSIYSRTTSEVHKKTASDFFLKLYNDGKFIEKVTEQFFDEQLGQFLADRYISGTCPKCGNDNAYGDQCEKCGSTLDPNDLINPKSMLSGSVPVKRPTKNWYLPLDTYQQRIKTYLEKHADWKPNVFGQCMSWLAEGEGLQPRSMTRDLDWGIPVPLENAEGKVLYVWFDAPIGYISNTIEYFKSKSGCEDDWKKYWQDKEHSRLVHFIGKDNIVFHCIIFPSMLMEHGEFVLPDNVPGNEFVNLEGKKISTSRNWAVWAHEYLEEFKGKEDELRYVLTSIIPETKDSEFTWKDYQLKVNSELVAIFGNLVNRVVVLTDKFFDGKVPMAGSCSELETFIKEKRDRIDDLLNAFKFREALLECMNIARHGNKLLTEKEPWKLIKTDKDATAIVLYDCLQIIANLGIIFKPFMPFTSTKLSGLLNLDYEKLKWSDISKQDLLKPGHQLGKPVHLFEKIDDEQIQFQIDKLLNTERKSIQADSQSSTKVEIPNLKPEISIDDFSKVQLTVGTILMAEKVEKADKLLKLEVDLGFEKRTVVSGIALYFKPEEIIGKQVVVVTNLAPRKMRGIESKGMILMAEDEGGNLKFISPTILTKNGADVK